MSTSTSPVKSSTTGKEAVTGKNSETKSHAHPNKMQNCSTLNCALLEALHTSLALKILAWLFKNSLVQHLSSMGKTHKSVPRIAK